jgi:hypothetical protein
MHGIPLAPPTLEYVEGKPIPAGYRLVERANRPLIATGLSLFALGYGISLGVSLVILSVGGDDGEEFAPLLVPVAGPFIALGTLDEGSATLMFDGITQTAGILLTVIGIFATDSKLERIDGPVALGKPEILVGPGTAAVRWQF